MVSEVKMRKLASLKEGNSLVEWYDFYGENRARFGNNEYAEPAEIRLIEVGATEALKRLPAR